MKPPVSSLGLKIWIDGFPLENRLQRGIGRVVHETVAASLSDASFTIGARSPVTWPHLSRVAYQIHADLDRGPIDPNTSKPSRSSTTRQVVPERLRAADIHHSHFFIPCPADGPVVIQHVHDMLPEAMPKIMGAWGKREVARKRRAIFAADALICLSAATRDELRRIYPDLNTPMHVVHLAGEHLAVAESPGPVQPYVLFVGHRHVYKNFHGVLRAMCCSGWPRDLQLHVVGRPPNLLERFQVHRHRLVNRIRWVGSLSDDDLAMRYARAAAFVFPSLMEGFGIPVLEAQRNHCPLVASDIPVFREVAGDGAVFFDPHDSESIAAAVAQAVATRTALIERGLVNASRFSWKKTAAETIAVYRESLRLKRPAADLLAAKR